MMKNISGRVELYVNPPVSVIIPQYRGTAAALSISSNPPVCQMSRNTSSQVLHASGCETTTSASTDGLR